MDQAKFERLIAPFLWGRLYGDTAVCLRGNQYKNETFLSRAEEGCTGNGNDWTALAKVYLREKKPDFVGRIKFDSDEEMFRAYSSDAAIMRTFVLDFREMCQDMNVMLDLLSRAKLYE